MRIALLTVLMSLTVTGTAWSQEQPDPLEAEIFEASHATYLALPEPPLGMAISRLPQVVDGKLIGFQVILGQEDIASKVLVGVELADRSSDAARVAACKGYVNGFIDGLKEAGLKMGPVDLPDLESADLKKPLDLNLQFTTADGNTIHVWKRIFFTSKGYDITVIGVDEEDLEYLSTWAKKVRPVLTAK